MSGQRLARSTLPRVLHPLRDPPLLLLWSGLAFSAVGDQVFTVALAWVAVQAFGRNAGYLTALQAAATLAVALLGGAWADRRAHRRLMVAADLGRAVVLLALVALWLALGTPPGWSLVLAVVALATGQALFRPALQASLPGLVAAPALLPAANALLDSTDRIARLVGPALVGLLAAALPMVHFVTLDAASFLASALCLVAIGRLVAPRVAGGVGAVPLAGRWRGIVRGFAAVRGHPLLGYVLATGGISYGAWYTALFLGLPLLLGKGVAEGAGIGGYGLVIASYGATNLLATLAIGGRAVPTRPAPQALGGLVLVGVGVLGLGIAGASLAGAALLPVLCLSAALGAIGGPLEDIPIAVLRQTKLPAADLAAAARATLVVQNVGLLAALLAAPAVIGAIGVAPAIAGCGAALVLVGAAGLPWLRRAES